MTIELAQFCVGPVERDYIAADGANGLPCFTLLVYATHSGGSCDL